jgi:branched-subunit amino acid transport protein
MTRWLIIAGMGGVTYAIRVSMLVFLRHDALPPQLRNALRYVTPAVLAAIIAPAVLYRGEGGDFSATLANDRLVAAVVAAAIAWLTRNVWVTIAAGMTALWLLTA